MSEIKLTNEQASRIAETLMQYAPEGWIKIIMLFKTNDHFTQIDTWAETLQTKEYGFQLEASDADIIESVFESIWNDDNKSWEVAEFAFDCDGNFSLSFQ